MLTTLKKNVAIATIAVGVAGGGAYAWAQTTPARPTLDGAANLVAATVADTGAATPAAPAGRRAALLRRAVHAELVVRGRNGTFQTVDIDRGTLGHVAADVLQIDRPDGKQVTVKVDDATRYRGISGASGLRTGDKIAVVSKDGRAVVVAQRAAPAPAPAPGAPQG